jgi:hypothetical protein
MINLPRCCVGYWQAIRSIPQHVYRRNVAWSLLALFHSFE